MFFQPIPNTPALYLPELKSLIIADLHIGIENELNDLGVHINSQTQTMKTMLTQICKKYLPEEIIILGDIKHTIPSTPFFEKKDIIDFLNHAKTLATIHIVPGNHDGFIEKMIPDQINICPSEGFTNKDIGFTHGHRWPKPELLQCKYLLCGHTHPTIKFTDRLGYHSFEPCWIKTKVNSSTIYEKYPNANPDINIIFFPAFNPLCGGIAVNDEGIVGPLKQIIDLDTAELFLLDGSMVGTVDQLK